MEELENKVLNEKYSIPINVNKDFKTIIQKCLQKKVELRPSIEEIIMSDIFQSKCQLNRITLPLSLNKAKQRHKEMKVDESGDVSIDAMNDSNIMNNSGRHRTSGNKSSLSTDNSQTNLKTTNLS